MLKKLLYGILFISVSIYIYYSTKVYDVQYYTQNVYEMVMKVKECDNNPGEKAKTPNCINAKAAYKKVIYKEK